MTRNEPSPSPGPGLPARRRWLLHSAAAVLLLDAAAVLGYLLLVHSAVPAAPDAASRPVGVVFFDDFAPGGGLGSESRDRVEHAARLFRDGRVARLVCVGGRRDRPQRVGARHMAEMLAELGVPPERIMHDRTSFDTRTNWESASEILLAGQWREPLLISSALHLYRIRDIAGDPFDIHLAPTRPVLDALKQKPLSTVAEVHREWIAWAAMWLLPPETHRDLVRRWRDFRH